MIKCLIYIVGLLLISSLKLSAQNDSTKLIQLSGVIVSESDLGTMPYATVFDKTDGRGVMADYYGYFSIVTKAKDTLYFSYYGYKTSSFIVPDTLKDNQYSIIHMMQRDTIDLPEVTVYPWPSREEFAKAFVEMNPTDDALKRAQRQLSGESLAFIAARIESDASLSYAFSQNQQNTQIYSRGMVPSNNLLNPLAWAKLVRDWKDGKLKRQ